MDTKDYLLKARDLLTKGWCQKAFARDGLGRFSSVKAGSACSYCLVGALEKIDAPQEVAIFIFQNAPESVFTAWHRRREGWLTTFLTQYNDAPTTTKEDILALIDTALENLK